jgi:hypothetical protein
MKFQSADIRTAAAKGLCKLLVNDRIKSPNLVYHLLIMWYNPVTGIVVIFMFYFCTACIVQRRILKFLDWSVMKYIFSLFNDQCCFHLSSYNRSSISAIGGKMTVNYFLE